MINEKTLAYIAGLFDGEGCLAVNRAKYNGKYYYYLRITITSSDKFVLDKVKEYLGMGKVYTRMFTNKDRLAVIFAYQINERKKILLFLKLIKPYSLIKKKAIAYLLKHWPKTEGIQRPKTRRKVYWRIKKLKRRSYIE